MSDQIQILIAFLLYLLAFSIIGWRRGSVREGWVFGIAMVGWLALQARGDIFVRIANLGSTFLAFIQAGGLGSDPTGAFGALGNAPKVVTAETRDGFLFIIWALLVLIVYGITGTYVRKSPSNGWAILYGIGNGLLFAAVFLPRLGALLVPEALDVSTRSTVDILLDLVGSGGVWTVVEPVRPIVILVLLILIVVGAASTIRGANA